MESTGSAPISSIFYLTKRKKLTERLFEHKNEKLQENQQYYYENIFNQSFHSRSHTNVGLHKNLVHLSQDRKKYESSDGIPLDVDDGLNRGLSYLSQYSELINLNEVDELSRNYSYKNQHQDKHIGKMEDIANLLNLNELSNTGNLQSEPMERDLELSNRYVGPLNVSEVGNLIVLALKLKENEKLDLDLEKRLEVSAQMWKNNRVPNTISTTLISSLYKNKPYQCETCGLRFNLIDTKKRHELTHRPKQDKFWYSLDGWIHLTSKGSFGFTYSRTQVTLDTFRTLLKEIPTDNDMVKWLKNMLFPNDENFNELDVEMYGDENNRDWEMKMNDRDDTLYTDGNNEVVGDERTLWSWGIMDSCSEIPSVTRVPREKQNYNELDVEMDLDKTEDSDKENKENEKDEKDNKRRKQDNDNKDNDYTLNNTYDNDYYYLNCKVHLDSNLLKEVIKKVSLNLFMVNIQKQVIGSFSDMSKAFCTICKDSLSCEFDVKYNKFVYVNTTAFQVDFELVNKVFEEYVPLSYLLSLDNLNKYNPIHLLTKMASIKVLCLDTKSKRELAVTDWSFKYTKELLDIETSIPKIEDVKYLDKLVKGWKNPFKINNKQLLNCILYAHTPCIKLLINTHLRWAKMMINTVEEDELRKQIKKFNLV